MANLTDISGVGPAKAETLEENGYESVEDVADADPDELADVDGVGDDRALEFIVGAEDLLGEDDDGEELADDEFDLTPSEVSEELEYDDAEEEAEEIVEEVEEELEEEEDETEDEPETHRVSISFESRTEFDTFHAALMRHHERVYTSNQDSADAMDTLLAGLDDFDSVSYELTEFELNTLHTAIKQQRTSYQGDNLIDHMDALQRIEEAVDEVRRDALF